MKVLMINTVCGVKSTGRLCTDLATELENFGHNVQIAYGRENVPKQYSRFAHKIGNDIDVDIHGCFARAFDATGFGSRRATEQFIRWMEEYDPDVVHLHNIHGYYINVSILFNYLKHTEKRIVWTLHDCWPFTGHCCYFDYVNCSRWKEKCYQCPQKYDYPSSVFDRSAINYEKKRALFTGIKDMTLVTPSQWLANLTRESFLSQYPVYTIPNWVDLTAFSRTPSKFREQYKIGKKIIVLGVASVWDRRKGLDVFLRLEELLGDGYQIVLVGITEKQRRNLPQSIIGISHTSSKHELAEIYSAADVFVNPTHEDNYPSTHLEAIACGTPVISFDVGGCSESANLFGTVVPENNITVLIDTIHQIVDGSITFTTPNLRAINQSSYEQYLHLLEGNV